MAQYLPQYRVTVFAPATVDVTESTVLTPAANAYHSDAFKIATITGLSGYQGYLDFPQGRKGQYDPQTGKLTVGSLNFRIQDKRNTTTSNLQRWVTAFFGDVNGKSVFSGLRAIVEESIDAGSTWTPYFAGRISDVQLDDPLWYSITVRDATDELNSQIFISQPANGTAGVALTSVIPVGLTAPYGPFAATSWFRGVIQAPTATTKTIQLDSNAQKSPLNHYTAVLSKAAGRFTSNTPAGIHLFSTAQFSSDLAGTYRVFISELNRQYMLSSVLLVNNNNTVSQFQVSALLDSGDPYYAPLSSLTNGATYNVRLAAAYQSIGTDNPLFISGQHPVSLFRDICQGQYGHINVSSSLPIKAMSIDATAFNTLIADTSFDIPRFKIDKQYTIVDFFEKYLSPFGFGYRVEAQASGSTIVAAIVPFDARIPTNFGSLPTITDTDLAAFDGTWQLGPVISGIQIKSYIEQPITPTPGDTNVPPYLIDEQTNTTFEIIPENSTSNGTTISIDALGVRTPSASVAAFTSTFGDATQDSPLQRMLAYYINRFGNGAPTANLTCRRTTTVQSLKVGMWCLVQVSILPDQTTHLRGGTRLMQVIERSENGMNVTLKFMDAGRNVLSVAPTVGALSASVNFPTSGIVVPITTYGTGSQRLQIDIGNVAIGDSQPSSGSATWQTWRYTTGPYQSGLRNWEIDNLAGGRRYYVRVRTSEIVGNLPSAWISASTPYIDLPTVAAPSSLVYFNLTPATVDLSWSNGSDTTSQIIVSVAAPSGSTLIPVAQLIPGSTQLTLSGLTGSAAKQPYLVAVTHYDASGGNSLTAYTSFTVSGSVPTCPNNPGRIIENTTGVTTYNGNVFGPYWPR